ncbi:DUF6279 family lipoprotein [Pseudomaricurvus sp.]|uniref:DUF6279 family lipoprotein n=1 Tax=Pseudomaricurvus sp. TaxID=2004510 RepID=UPI003F6D7114
MKNRTTTPPMKAFPIPLQYMPTPALLRRLTLIGCLCLGLISCSLRVTYPFMDWWLGWKVDDFVSLNSQQENQLEKTLDQFHRWHQHTQLPLYARELAAFKQQLQQPDITPEQLRTFGEQAHAHWLASLDYAMPEIQSLFMSLSASQWQEFTEAITEKTEEDTEPYVESTPEERIELRQERLEKGMDDWIGRQTDAQEEMVLTWSQNLNYLSEISREEQQRWIDSATLLYQQRHTLSQNDLRTQLRTLIAEETALWSPGHRKLLEENRERSLRLFADLHASLSDKQKKRLLNRLTDIEDDLNYLYQKTLIK